jgi:hypothetical protein
LPIRIVGVAIRIVGHLQQRGAIAKVGEETAPLLYYCKSLPIPEPPSTFDPGIIDSCSFDPVDPPRQIEIDT